MREPGKPMSPSDTTTAIRARIAKAVTTRIDAINDGLTAKNETEFPATFWVGGNDAYAEIFAREFSAMGWVVTMSKNDDNAALQITLAFPSKPPGGPYR